MNNKQNQNTAVDLLGDPITLTENLVDIPSPSGSEKSIADAIETGLRLLNLPGVEVLRFNHNVMARTNRGLAQRVMLAGHLDTVPIADNVPSHRAENEAGQDTLFGCGSVDMKSGLAVYLHTFASLAASPNLKFDLTFIAYECEEVAYERNGLGHIQKSHPGWMAADLALLGEPSGGWIEAGCQGNIRIRVSAHGTRAHSARGWMGDNAMHKLSPHIARIANYHAQEVEIDGLTYREGLNIVHCESGVATNVIPDLAWMFVNFRFAPNRSIEDAIAHALEVIGTDDVEWELDDASGAALPGLSAEISQELIKEIGQDKIRAKFGWTDVARFSALGVPALNFGPGDPSFAHKRDEQCPVTQISEVAAVLKRFLSTDNRSGLSWRVD